MRDDLTGAKAIADHIGNCAPSLIPELMEQGWPIVKVGRTFRSTKTAIDRYLHRKEEGKPDDNTRLVIQLEELRDRIERILQEIGGSSVSTN